MNGHIAEFKTAMTDIFQAIDVLLIHDGSIVSSEDLIDFLGDRKETEDSAVIKLWSAINNLMNSNSYLAAVTARIARDMWNILADP